MGVHSAGRPGLVGAMVVTLAATAAIVATYSRLSHTWDEGTHVSAGIELLQDGRYTVQSENPPLARAVLAVIPYLSGARVPPPADRTQGFAVDVFYRAPDYVRNVTEARLANLLFFWLCVGFTWVLAGGRSDPWAAFLAAAAIATLPPIVAHSGFATTDVPFVAAFLLALVALRRLLARPGVGTAALFGAALGCAIATKFSTLVFFPPAAAAIVACELWPSRQNWRRAIPGSRFRRILGATAAAKATAALVVWAAYEFHVGRLADLPTRFGIYGTMPESGWPALIRNWSIPGDEFVHGLLFLRAHAIAGHAATLLGEFSQRGFVLYYPIVLLTKTPLPFLLFAAAGLVALVRSPATPARRFHLGCALGAGGILIIAMASPINLGVRHVLVIYPLVALAAAHGLARQAELAAARGRGPWTSRRGILGGALICLALQTVLLARSVPNQIAFFNLLAGREPAFVSSDSDFDWGQDMLALERYVAAHPIPELYVALSGTTRACEHHLPPLKALPPHPVTGWIAISERIYQLNRGGIRRDPCGPPGGMLADPGWLDWLKAYRPVAIVGKTVRLYHIEPGPSSPGVSDAGWPASSPPG